ncbi:hybrid sensor histidine kinase/response regulator [Labilibacter sediminis]|nr:hybrid sensor histidine kinase/response regulator [Labilibacter sediminis]
MKKGRILIVDDNPKNIQLLGNILNDSNYEVEIALGGNETIEWLEEEPFDLLLLDVMMPEINGFEVCKIIRSKAKFDLMPIIYISAKTDKESMVYGFEVGGQDFISKPFDTSELLARVNTHIELKKSKEGLIKINNELEKKVAERTEELQKSNDELKRITETKDKFLSFLGNEITCPLKSINQVIHTIKRSAESARLSEMITLLESSVDKLDLITNMANQITQIKSNKSVADERAFSLINVIEYTLVQLDDMLDAKNVNLKYQINSDIEIKGNKELIKNSLTGVLNVILKYIDIDETIHMFSSQNGRLTLSIESKIKDWNNKEFHELPEETLLYFSYAEIVMSFLRGEFSVKANSSSYSFVWKF